MQTAEAMAQEYHRRTRPTALPLTFTPAESAILHVINEIIQERDNPTWQQADKFARRYHAVKAYQE